MLVLCSFLRKFMVSEKRFTGLLELIQIYKQNQLEKFLIFTIYQNYTLALIHILCYHNLSFNVTMTMFLFKTPPNAKCVKLPLKVLDIVFLIAANLHSN